MSSDYIKQLEDTNWSLKNRLEQFESRCEWLEKLHLLHITGRWSIETTYDVGINTYKSGALQNGSAYITPKDPIIAEIMQFTHEDIISPNVVWKNNADKVTLKYEYEKWKASMMVFVGLAKTIYDADKYKDINKLVLTTHAYIGLARLTADIADPYSFDYGNNEKSFLQGITFTIKRGERLPICKVRVNKQIDGLECNNKFMSFRTSMKFMNGIYEAMENLAKAEKDLEEHRRRERDATR